MNVVRMQFLCVVFVGAAVNGCASSPSSATKSSSASPRVIRPPASAAVQRAEQMLKAGKAKWAKKVLLRALADDPEDVRAWLDLGLAYEGTGAWQHAERAYRRATLVDPHFAEPYNNLGVLLRERGQLLQATQTLESAVALDPTLAAARFNLALCYEDQKKRSQAEREYREAIRLGTSDPIARINLALMLVDSGRRKEAAKQLRIVVPMVKTDPLLSVAVGNGLRRSGHPEEASSLLSHVLEQLSKPPPIELLAELGLAQYASGQLDAAENTMRRALEQDEGDPSLQYVYGSMLAKQGKTRQARIHLQRAISLDPGGAYSERARAKLRAMQAR